MLKGAFLTTHWPNTLNRFLALPNRDAYATIRGFLYQAALTVQAWLSLSSTELLELESGEDIDWRSLAEGNISSRIEIDRVLGQVKYRENGLSLRSEVSLSSLVNFHDHRARNPQFHLHFRFISNARIIQERGHMHPSGLKGIELWTSLDETLTDPVERADRLTFLRNVLLAPSEPASIDRKRLADFRSFVRKRPDEEFLDFIRSFCWMRSSRDLEAALVLAKEAIRKRAELHGFEQADAFCLQALFLHVLLLLSQPGTKELRPQTCTDVINDSLKEAAETVAQGLSSAREQVSYSADLLVGQTQELSKIITELSTQAATVQVAGQSIPGSPMIILGTIAPILEPPSLVLPTAPRSDLCSKIALYRESKNAVALVGDIACGKSQLALLAVAGIDKITWSAFRANEGIDPSALLDAAFQKCLDGSSEPESPSRALVIDDLEIGLKSGKFVDRLPLVARALRTQGVFLVVCSTRRLPSALQDQFATIPIGGYQDDDIQVLLQAKGAPSHLNNDRFRTLVSSVTGGHPLLVGSLLQFLVQRAWRIDDAGIDALFSRAFANDIREEMQARLLAQEQSGAKELLYRVSLATHPITQDQALSLGEIPPTIPNRNEELTVLLDTWLQRSGTNRVLVSPLVANLGEKNLPSTVRCQVHDRLAGWILKSKDLTQADAILCISHLMLAGKAETAGIILVQSMQAMLPVAEKLKDTSLFRLWQHMPLPVEMRRELRILIRGYQVAIGGLLNKNIDYEFKDLLALAKQTSGDFGHLSVFGAGSVIAIYLAKKAPMLALRSATIAFEHNAQLSTKKQEELRTDFGVSGVLWVIGAGCNTREEIREWLVKLGHIPNARREALLRSDIANESAWMIFQKLWVEEQKLPSPNRDWASLMAFLENCEGLAAKAGIPLLVASAFRAQQSIRIVHLEQAEDGDRRARKRIENFPKAGPEDFLISAGTAIYLTDAERWDLALSWFNRAAECTFEGLAALRMQNQLRRAEALYRAGQDPERVFAEAENIAENSEELGELDTVLCLVERAMWQWVKGDHVGCLYTWDRALELILAQDHSTTRWKNLFTLMGNHTSFFCTTASGNGVSTSAITPPMMGIYMRDYDISGLYSEGSAWFALAPMVWFAESLGEAMLASKWALKTVETADSIAADPRSKFVLLSAVPTLLAARDYEETVNYARESALAMTMRPQFNVSEEMRALRPELAAIENNWKPVDPENAELWAIVHAVLPALIDIVALSIEDESSSYTLLSSLTEKCLQVATKQSSPSWHAAAKALTDLATGTLDWSVEFASNDDRDGSAVVRELLVAFGSGFASRRTPRDVFVQQVRWTGWLKRYFASPRSMSALVAKSLAGYWTAVLERNTFYFTSPRETKREFFEASQKQRIEGVFKAVAKGLSIRPPEWLRDLN
jgi:hypothetical protein